MRGAAFVAYPLAFTVYTYRVQSAQNTAAFSADADDGLTTVTAEDIFRTIFWMLPDRSVFCFVTEIARLHLSPRSTAITFFIITF